MLKTFVLGLDGATFKLLTPWVESGDLPNLKKLIESGTSAVMDSCLPPVTCPNWKCYSTGKNPGKLGIYWWERVDVSKRKIESVNYAEQVKSKEIWDWLNEGGYRTAVINMPTTYPPRKINGCMIAGGPDCPEEKFTYPVELEIELKKNFNYRVHPEGIGGLRQKKPQALKNVLQQIEGMFAAAQHFLKQDAYDFIHFTIFSISSVQHFLWNDDLSKVVWKLLDKEIGALLLLFPPGCNFIVMSDHGMREVQREFYINKWLEDGGYLRLKDGVSGKGFIGARGKSKAKGLLKRFLLRRGSMAGEDVFGGNIREAKAAKLDWEGSRAVASGQGPLYLIDKQDGDYEKLREEIIKGLSQLKDPKTGVPVMAKVSKIEAVYPVILSDNAPDLMLEPAAGYRINGEVGHVPLFSDCQRWAAENDQPGIFLAYGKDINTGLKLSGMKITDIAPTILYSMGIPVPQDMDGRVLKEIFKEDFAVAQLDTKPKGDETQKFQPEIYNQQEEEMVKKRLEELGYLG